MDFRGGGGATTPKGRTRAGPPAGRRRHLSMMGAPCSRARRPDPRHSRVGQAVDDLWRDQHGHDPAGGLHRAWSYRPTTTSILGARPISSRTYFTARMAAVLDVHHVRRRGPLSSFPALVGTRSWWHLGIAGLIATFGAVILCDVCASVLIVTTVRGAADHRPSAASPPGVLLPAAAGS